MNEYIFEQLLQIINYLLLDKQGTEYFSFSGISSVSSILSLIITFINLILILNFTYRFKKKKKISYLIKRLQEIFNILDGVNSNFNTPLPTDIMHRVINTLDQLRSESLIFYLSSTHREINKIKKLKYENRDDLDKVVISLKVILTNFEEIN